MSEVELRENSEVDIVPEKVYSLINTFGEGPTAYEEDEEQKFERKDEMREVLNQLGREIVKVKKEKGLVAGEVEIVQLIAQWYEKVKAANHYGLELI